MIHLPDGTMSVLHTPGDSNLFADRLILRGDNSLAGLPVQAALWNGRACS